MKHEELNKFHETVCNKARDLLKIKNHDYASKENALKNIIDAADNCGISPVVGCWNRSSDKFARISNFIRNGMFKVEDEKLEDTIYDLINYTIFVLALYEESKLDCTPGKTILL